MRASISTLTIVATALFCTTTGSAQAPARGGVSPVAPGGNRRPAAERPKKGLREGALAAATKTVNCALPATDTPTGKTTGRWRTVARFKGKLSDLAKVNELDYACVGGGLTRGILRELGPIEGLDVHALQTRIVQELAADAATKYTRGKPVTGSGGTITWVGGGSAGNVDDFKRIKNRTLAWLKATYGTGDIHTDVVKPTGTQKAFMQKLAAALSAGKTVEVDVDLGDGSGHFAFLVEIVERGADYGFILADDPSQGDGKAATALRGPYFVRPDGSSYYFDKKSGNVKTLSENYKLRGALIEKKK